MLLANANKPLPPTALSLLKDEAAQSGLQQPPKVGRSSKAVKP